MSELKEHLFCECDECIREYRGPLSNEMRPYYIKSEADKVIAEKDDEIVKLKDKLQNISELLNETRKWLIESQRLHKRCADNAIKGLSHNKYKRCLAMAKYCHESAMWLEECGVTKYVAFMLRWEKRWLELAERFK